MAFELLKHAINMILTHIGEAIKASAVPLVILLGLAFAVGGTFADLAAMDPTMMSPADIDYGSILFSSIVMLAAYLILFGWLAVSWHRFILLGERPNAVPQFAGKNVGAYILQLIMLFVVLIGVGLVIGIVGGLLGSIIPGLSLLVSLALVLILGIAYLRLALTLPAVAVGERLDLMEAWNRTKPHAGTFVGIFFLLALLRIVVALPGLLLSSVGLGIIATGVDVVATWFTLMVGVGILTTLYGHIIEGRELN